MGNSKSLSEKEVQRAKLARRSAWMVELVPIIGLVALVIAFSIATKGLFLKPDNLSMIIGQSFTLIIASLGAVFIYSFGALNVALGSITMVAAIFATNVANATGSWILSLLTSIFVAVLAQSITAFVACKMNVIPFVGSLCIAFICSGLGAELVTTGQVTMAREIADVVDRPVVKIIVIIVAIIVCYILFEHTKIGHYCKAIGGSEVVAEQSGIPVAKYKYIAFLISGIMLGIATFFLLCRNKMATTATGEGLHMQVMLAIILGGMSLKGGPRSRITAPVIGSLLLYTLSNGMTLIGISPYYVEIIQGAIFLIVIFLVFPKKKYGSLPK